jgi:hypothetical protein
VAAKLGATLVAEKCGAVWRLRRHTKHAIGTSSAAEQEQQLSVANFRKTDVYYYSLQIKITSAPNLSGQKNPNLLFVLFSCELGARKQDACWPFAE